MIVRCPCCERYFEDVYRSTACPHDAFPANDGENNFAVHDDSYLSFEEPAIDRVFEAHMRKI
jgi:hypothetical protein